MWPINKRWITQWWWPIENQQLYSSNGDWPTKEVREPTVIGEPVEKRRISIGKGLCREAVEAIVVWGLIDEWRRPRRFGARESGESPLGLVPIEKC